MGADMKATTSLSNWQTKPHSDWAFRNVSEVLSCAEIPTSRGQKTPPHVCTIDLGDFKITDAQGKNLSLDEFHDATVTDGFIVQREGQILYDVYRNGNSESSKHLLFSATKSVVGLLLGILEKEGIIDIDAPVSRYVPEIAHTAYVNASSRNLIDMRAGAQVDMWDYGYRTAMGWTPTQPDKPPTPDMKTYFANLNAKASPNGGPFHYVSQHTDLLGWVIERAAGASLSELISEKIWKPMGAGEDALMTVDANGLARAAGGMCTTLRDLVAVGQVVAYGGFKTSDRSSDPIVPPSWLEDTAENGEEDAWKRGNFAKLFENMYPNANYRNAWYILEGRGRKFLAASGLFGQQLIVDPSTGLVVAKTSSQSSGFDVAAMRLTYQAFEEIRRIVIQQQS